MTVIGIFLGVFVVVGAVVCALGTAGGLYYLTTRRPTPNTTPKDAVTSIDWPMAFAFLIAPPALAGYQEFGGVSGVVSGGAIGTGFVLFMVGLVWWWGI